MKSTSRMLKPLLGTSILLLVFALVGQAAAQSWTKLSPTGGPPAGRLEASAVYDPGTNRMVLFAGQEDIGNCGTSCLFNDVWVLEHANGLGGTPAWSQLAPTGSLPPTPTNYGVVYDQANNRLIVFTETNPHQLWILEHANGLGGNTELEPSGFHRH